MNAINAVRQQVAGLNPISTAGQTYFTLRDQILHELLHVGRRRLRRRVARERGLQRAVARIAGALRAAAGGTGETGAEGKEGGKEA